MINYSIIYSTSKQVDNVEFKAHLHLSTLIEETKLEAAPVWLNDKSHNYYRNCIVNATRCRTMCCSAWQ